MHPSPKTRGFTLVELLVAMTIASIVMGVFVKLLFSTTRYRREIEARLETHQGLKAAIDALTRDVRLAGACVPAGNTFLPMNGVDARTQDQIGVVIGELFENACVNSTVTATVPAGTSQILVGDAARFRAGQLVYLIHPADTLGEFRTIRSVNAAGNALLVSPGVGRDYPVPAGVWAVQQRNYAIATTLGPPMLTLSIDGARAQPMALGIQHLDVRYRLRQNCPACTVVSLPNAAQWPLVTDVLIDITARSVSAIAPATFYTVTEQIRVKPRNLLP